MIRNFYLKHKAFGTDYLWRTAQVVAKEGVTMILFFMAVYHLSPDLLGMYSYIMAGVFLLIMFSDFGFSVATSTLVAEYAQKSPKTLKKVLFTIGFPVSVISGIVALLSFIYVFYTKHDSLIYFYAILPLLFAVPLTALLDGILRGTRQFKKLATVTFLSGSFGLIFGYLLISSYGLLGAFYAQSCFFVLLLFFLLGAYNQFSFSLDRTFLTRTLKYSLIIGITGVGYFLFTRINVIIIGQSGYLFELAHYEIIQKIVISVLIPFAIFAQVLAPRITTFVAQNNWQSVHRWYIKSIVIAGIVGGIIAMILYGFLAFFGNKFSFGSYDATLFLSTLIILIPVLVTQAMSSVAATGFSTASGHAHINMYILLIFGLLNLVTTYSFISFWGYLGAVYATLLVKVFADVVFLSVYYVILKKQICQK